MSYTVGEIAKLIGITPSTLRYYDKEGLLPFVKRSSGGIRIFEQKIMNGFKSLSVSSTLGCN